MTDFSPDTALETAYDGRYGVAGQGLPAPMWYRHPSIDVATSPSPLPVKIMNDCTAPVMVQDCPQDKQFQTLTLCDPGNNAQPVFVVRTTTQAGVVTQTYTNVDGTSWTGNPTTLQACDEAEVYSDAEVMCDGGTTTFWRFVLKHQGIPTGAHIDTDINGAPYTPIGAVTSGACLAKSAEYLIYTAQNTAMLNMAAIIAASGAKVINALSVLQISGTGHVTGDTGGGFSLNAGETHNWSASESSSNNLGTSKIVLDAGGGIQHVTANYI